MRFLMMFSVLVVLGGNSAALANTERGGNAKIDLYDDCFGATNVRECRPANVIEWHQGDAFTLGIQLHDRQGNALGDTRVTLTVVDRNDKTISDALMLWGKESVVANTNAEGQVFFRRLFFPHSFIMGARLVVTANVAGVPNSRAFSLITTTPPRLVGAPKYYILETFPPSARWVLTYDQILRRRTSVTWYAIASDGITSTYTLEPSENRTNRVFITVGSTEVNRNLYTGKCHTLVVRVAPVGAAKDTITSSKINC